MSNVYNKKPKVSAREKDIFFFIYQKSVCDLNNSTTNIILIY